MKTIKLIILVLTTFFLGQCSDKKKLDETTTESTQEKPVEKVVYPFEFIDSKTESAGGNTNIMDLYVPVNDLNIKLLRDLCSEQKENKRDQSFYYLVVFDKKENAVFPNNPFTALYGIDEEPQKHIIAVYEYSSINGLSKLISYSPNMWEGKPVTVKVY